MYKSVVVFLLFIGLTLQIAIAQESNVEEVNEKGIYLGLSLLGTSFELPEIGDSRDTGAGLGFEIGYNFNRNLALFLSLDGSKLTTEFEDEYALSHFDLGVEGRLDQFDDKFIPYGKVSFLGVAMASEVVEVDVELSGTGFGVGAGVYYFLNNNFAIDLGYTHSFLTIDELTVGNITNEIDENESSGRLGLGISYHF